MTVKRCNPDDCMEACLRCRQLSPTLLAWEDINRMSEDRILRIEDEEFRGNVLLTNALGAMPDFKLIPKLRFYEPGLVHVSTISLSDNGTPWIMCVCNDKCGKCTDSDVSES